MTVGTVTEQLLYEVHDPARYITPDVVADFSSARLQHLGDDRVAVSGVSGGPRPDTLKVSVGYVDSFVGEGQISYAGPNAVARGRLALDVVRDRLDRIGVPMIEARYDLVGLDAVHLLPGTGARPEPDEVRARVAVRTRDLAGARRVGHEVAALWLNGPAGGGGVTRSAIEDIGIASVLLPRDVVAARAVQVTGESA